MFGHSVSDASHRKVEVLNTDMNKAARLQSPSQHFLIVVELFITFFLTLPKVEIDLFRFVLHPLCAYWKWKYGRLGQS